MFTVEDGEVLEDDPEDPMRTAIRQMRGVFAQLDKTMTVKKLRDGRNAKAATGKKAVGACAYGSTGQGKGRCRDASPMTPSKLGSPGSWACTGKVRATGT